VTVDQDIHAIRSVYDAKGAGFFLRPFVKIRRNPDFATQGTSYPVFGWLFELHQFGHGFAIAADDNILALLDIDEQLGELGFRLGDIDDAHVIHINQTRSGLQDAACMSPLPFCPHVGYSPAMNELPALPDTASGPKVITFGCRLNAYESEVMRGHAETTGDADLVVINTCAVTAEAERQARQAIRKIKRDSPNARIVVTGCAAQIAPDAWAAMPEVSRVLGNIEKMDAASFLFSPQANDKIDVADIMTVRETAAHLVGGFAERARAFVEVQQGCDHRCTFCIIPFGRGNSRSVPAGLVIERIRRLVDKGFNEVVLTGVDLTSWGPDLPGGPTLGNLVQRILTLVPDLPRLRLSSIDSIEVDDGLMDAITGDHRVMPHLHLSLQHGDDIILKRMKRRHLRDAAIDFCARVRARRPDVVFGADIIAGFPTEDDAAFENALSLVDACDLTYLHVFPYSERAGTPAAKMPQVPVAVRKERAAALRAKGDRKLQQYLASQTGAVVDVLVERENGSGHTAHFAPVLVTGKTVPGGIFQARVTGYSGTQLFAEVA
jgi:threonylcarbamoyladenosine tRNA methylthiotransferase MtaB